MQDCRKLDSLGAPLYHTEWTVDCGNYWNRSVPWFGRSTGDRRSSRSSVSLHVGGNCRLLVCTPKLLIQLFNASGRTLCAAGELATWAPVSGTFPHYGTLDSQSWLRYLMRYSTASRWADPALGFAVGWVSSLIVSSILFNRSRRTISTGLRMWRN